MVDMVLWHRSTMLSSCGADTTCVDVEGQAASTELSHKSLGPLTESF